MATYFVVSDVHGFYTEMSNALIDAGFDIDNKNHVFISLGDLFDRGPEARLCLEFVNWLPNDRKILIRGNHEDMLEECFARGEFLSRDYHNKTDDTIFQFASTEDKKEAIKECSQNREVRKYLSSCIDYFETDKYIFVHGWIPCKERGFNTGFYSYDKNWRNREWTNARWICCFDGWAQGVIEPNKTIVAGHWHTSYGHSKYHHYGNEWEEPWVRVWNEMYPQSPIKGTACFDIFKDKGIIAIDACTAYSGKVNVLKIGRQKALKYYQGELT